MSAFIPFEIESRTLLELDGLRVIGWKGAVELTGGTSFGLVTATSRIAIGPDKLVLRAGSYFVAPEPVRIESGRGLAIVVRDYRGLRQVGGPIETSGRLRYIDGCSDTLVVSPPRLGEPCLNHLHVPTGTDQSAHTHSSARIGVIVRGRGRCQTPAGPVDLYEGLAWYIPAGLRHSFLTGSESLDVLAWHPDSDFGPTDENHPMVNRTLLAPPGAI